MKNHWLKQSAEKKTVVLDADLWQSLISEIHLNGHAKIDHETAKALAEWICTDSFT